MKKIIMFILAGSLLLIMDSCYLSPVQRQISGTIYGVPGTANLVIGAFPNSFNFYTAGGPYSDEVTSESSSAIQFSPLVKATVNPINGTYTITLPANISDMGDLIAWTDTNGNGLLDFNDGIGEYAYFPIVTSSNYAAQIGTLFNSYCYSYYDGYTTNIESIDAYNADIFNFNIDR